MAEFSRTARLADGREAACRLTATDAAPWIVRAEIDGDGEAEAEHRDLFDALAAVRTRLAAEGTRLLVQGAARDVYPSGLMREAGGRHAYRMRPGRRAERADVVDIFAPAEPDRIAGVDEQRKEFEAWTRSFPA